MSEPLTLGHPQNFWLWTANSGFDLTHRKNPPSKTDSPYLTFETSDGMITIDPLKTALVTVDMQNYSLSQPLNKHHAGHDAEKALAERAIPTARSAGIQVIWLNWGLSEADLAVLPPSLHRIWAFDQDGAYRNSREVGTEMGEVEVEGGGVVAAGRFLLREQWNTDLHAPLEALRRESLRGSRPDVLLYKNRISGMCGGSSVLGEYLNGEGRGITTLLFAGINVDFCVISTMAAASMQDYDTILLEDCSGTTNGKVPLEASLMACRKGWGFLSSCTELEKGLEKMLAGESSRRLSHVGPHF